MWDYTKSNKNKCNAKNKHDPLDSISTLNTDSNEVQMGSNENKTQ